MANLKFSVDSALLRELGEKLVETVHLALVELVKNAYDADATKVKVSFVYDEDCLSEIRIADNGIGMNFEDVKNYWMRIATTNKTKENVSPIFGRYPTGAKGIGRFSCRRLGGRLKLVTQGAKNGKSRGRQPILQRTVAEFPWVEFEPGTNVTEIECPGKQTTVENERTGTTLIISEVSGDEWTTQGFNWLKRQLAVLAANRGVRRPEFKEDPGFNIVLKSPDFDGGVKDIREDLINAGWGTLTAFINDKHQAVCKLDSLDMEERTIISQMTFPHLRDVSLMIAIMVNERDQMRDTSVLSKGSLNQILPLWGGVQIRYHGFRIYPYGDDDWLGIDHDRGLRRGGPNKELTAFANSLRGVVPGRSLLTLLSMRNYMGNVEIGAKASGFEPKANREGFLSSPAVDELREFVRFAIDWSTIYHDFYLKNRAQKETEIARRSFEELAQKKTTPETMVESAIEYIQKEVKNMAQYVPLQQRGHVEQTIALATGAILKSEISNRQELSHLRLVASTSTLLLIFSHEVKSLLSLLELSKDRLAILEEKIRGQDKNLLTGLRDDFIKLKDRFDDLLKLTSLMSVDSRKAEPGQISLKDRIMHAVKIFKLIKDRYNVRIDYDQVPNNTIVKNILEAELYAILLNVLSNSIKSVIAAGGERKIQITAERVNNKTLVTVRDTGVGIDPSLYEEVFVPFVADPDDRLYGSLNKMLNPEDKYIVGTGSGLGLSIVREIVTARNGSIEFSMPPKGWNSELEITLP